MRRVMLVWESSSGSINHSAPSSRFSTLSWFLWLISRYDASPPATATLPGELALPGGGRCSERFEKLAPRLEKQHQLSLVLLTPFPPQVPPL